MGKGSTLGMLDFAFAVPFVSYYQGVAWMTLNMYFDMAVVPLNFEKPSIVQLAIATSLRLSARSPVAKHHRSHNAGPSVHGPGGRLLIFLDWLKGFVSRTSRILRPFLY